MDFPLSQCKLSCNLDLQEMGGGEGWTVETTYVCSLCGSLTTLGRYAIVVPPSRRWGEGWWRMVVEFPAQAPSGVKLGLISPLQLCQNGQPGCENQGRRTTEAA